MSSARRRTSSTMSTLIAPLRSRVAVARVGELDTYPKAAGGQGLELVSSPPWASTIAVTIESPRPSPFSELEQFAVEASERLGQLGREALLEGEDRRFRR